MNLLLVISSTGYDYPKMDSRGRIPVQLPVPNPTPSYWHEPKAAIANYRSADNLPSSADYVIIDRKSVV